MNQQKTHCSKSGHTPCDQNAQCQSRTNTTNCSGPSSQESPCTGGASDWIERFDCSQRCANYIRKVVEDCLSGMINMPSTGNWSWKIPERKVKKDEGDR